MRTSVSRLSLAMVVLASQLVTRPASARAATPRLAGDTLMGRVLDKNGHAVVGAAVLLPDLQRSAVTDSDGTFHLVGIPAGKYTILVRVAGFAPLVKEISTSDATGLTLTLTSAALALEAITVTATRQAIAPLESPLPTSSLSEDRLRRNATISLAHSLTDLAGVHAVTTGGEIGKPMIRGMAGARVLVLSNGNRIEDYSWSDEDAPSIDARLAQRVEVIRGPASVLYGSDALGGVVNVIPAAIPDANGGAAFARWGADVYGASNNSELGTALRLEGAGGSMGWRLSGVGRMSEALHTPQGELDNTGFSALNGEGAFGWRGATGNATLTVSHYGGAFKLLEANGPPPGAAAGQDEGPERRLADERVQFNSNLVLGRVRLETKAQYQRHSLIEISDDASTIAGLPPAPPSSKTPAFDLLLNTASLDILAHHALGAAVHGTFGVSGLWQTNDTRGPIPLVPGATLSTGAAFLFEEARLGQWSLLAGGRIEGRHLRADSNVTLGLGADTRDYTPLAGDVGLVFRPIPDLALAVNVGRAWRAPTLFELFSNGPLLAEARYDIGQADLVPETGTDYDASARWAGGPLRAEFTAFRNELSNYIYITPTAQLRPVGAADTFRVYRYVQADARIEGFEGSAELEAASAVTLRGRFDYVRGLNRTTTAFLPLMPPMSLAGGVELHGRTSWADRAHLGAEVEYTARQDQLSPLDITPDSLTGSRALLNLSAGVEREWRGRPLVLDVEVRNALDTSYKDFLSRYKEFALNPGRNIIVRLSVAP